MSKEPSKLERQQALGHGGLARQYGTAEERKAVSVAVAKGILAKAAKREKRDEIKRDENQGRGRPKRYENAAERQRAYRQRKRLSDASRGSGGST